MIFNKNELLDNLDAMKEQGLSIEDCIEAFGTPNSPYITAAQEQFCPLGRIEIEAPTVVQEVTEEGAYVLAWVWVDAATINEDRVLVDVVEVEPFEDESELETIEDDF